MNVIRLQNLKLQNHISGESWGGSRPGMQM